MDLDRIAQSVEDLHRRFDNLERHLFGNGSPGLRERLSILEAESRNRMAVRASLIASMAALGAVILQFFLGRG